MAITDQYTAPPHPDCEKRNRPWCNSSSYLRCERFANRERAITAQEGTGVPAPTVFARRWPRVRFAVRVAFAATVVLAAAVLVWASFGAPSRSAATVARIRPIAGQHRSGGGAQVGPNLAFRPIESQWPQRGHEYLRGQILGVDTISDLREQELVHPYDVVAVHLVPAVVSRWVCALRNQMPASAGDRSRNNRLTFISA